MQPFHCSVCNQLLFFENSICLHCGSGLGFDPTERSLVTITRQGAALVRADGSPKRYRRCANQLAARCNWLVPDSQSDSQSVSQSGLTAGPLCESCELTTVRPNDADGDGRTAFADAESAKRRLLFQLFSLGLPVVSRAKDPIRGLAFELRASHEGNVITGHESGVITLDLSESDDAYREFIRQQLGEAYRTVLGHFRHEIAHYYWPKIVVDAGMLVEFRTLFGDETQSYEDAKQGHYQHSGVFDPASGYVSQYATMHPWEDWAETFAHYLHIDAGLHTADAYGLAITSPTIDAGRAAYVGDPNLAVAPMVTDWLVLTIALNAMSRSIGQGELYPFVLSPRVIDKLDFVHRCVRTAAGPDHGH